jgi:phenylalanyl-tRNA synthetase beta chain
MAYGQPMHCFDADMVKGHKIVVRTQPEGTEFITLDGEKHILGEHDLSICNAEEPMCIAGIFGGKGSGTYETTRNVVLESAYFHPTWIRKSARRHGLSTDASFRFERGVDPNGTIYALKQAAILCQELAGGKVSMQIKDVYPNPLPDFNVNLKYEYCDRLIGKQLGHDTIKRIVTSLEMKINAEDEEGLQLTVPAYRVDVQRPCDVVEDILRIYGYNNVEIPTMLKSSLTIENAEDKEHKLENIVSEQLVGCGFNEILNNSLTKESYYNKDELNAYPWANTVKVMNPLSADLGVMRQTLVFGGLESLLRNINRKRDNLRFFEVGNVYHYAPEKDDHDAPISAYSQEYNMALWVTGKRVQGSWTHPDEDSSFYELKAYVQNILSRAGVAAGLVVESKTENNLFAYGLTLKLRNGKTLAEYGKLSHKITHEMGIDQEVFYAEINWTAVVKAIKKNKIEFKHLSKYPAVSRDLALLVDDSVEFAQIEQIARQTEKKLLKSVTLFDVYQGKNLPAGKKSYAVNFQLEDEERTLTDKQIDAMMQKLVHNLTTKLGAELR